MRLASALALAALCAAAPLSGCSPGASRAAAEAEPSEGLILGAEEGERRLRRPRTVAGTPGLTTPFILKVDAQNGGSRDLVMGYEDIAPGQAIQPHQHLLADEIIFVHRGSGVASLGNREGAVSAGSTIYIPRNTRIGMRNTGPEPMTIAFVFSKPGFEQLMRENSVREGEVATPLSPEEVAETRARHRWHTVYDQP